MRVPANIGKRAAIIFVVAFLAIQITVPTVALFGPRPARYSWQMYSGVRTQAGFEIVHDDGTTADVVLRDYLGQPRGDIDFVDVLPAHICQVESDVQAVRINQLDSTESLDVPCNQ